MSAVRVRVELKKLPANASYDQQDRAFKSLFAIFKKRVNDSGVLTDHRAKQYYESPGEKKRRKRKESTIQKSKDESLKTKLREHFGRG